MGKTIGTFLIAQLLATVVPLGATTCWVSRIPGEVGPDSWTIIPPDPTTKDVVWFSGPTRVYGNSCVASVLQGYANITLDTEQRKIELWFQPIPSIPCPQIWLPLCGLEGQFGPLESGDWLFFSAQTDVPFSIPFRVAEAEYILNISVIGDGAVRLEPQPPYRLNDRVTVYAEPNAGWVFARWKGDVLWENQTTNPLNLMLDVDKSVTAVFGRLIFVPQHYLTIQAAIDAASDGDKITVLPGIYVENLNLPGKNIVLCSTDPGDPDVVATTIIDGNQRGSVVTFAGTEDHTCVLTGFTIRNGKAEAGGGVCGGTQYRRTCAALRDCAITQNLAGGDEAQQGFGGGVAYFNGMIANNTIVANQARIAPRRRSPPRGGGLFQCNGYIMWNTISHNAADGSGLGGGLCECDSVIRGNRIVSNSASVGGGLYGCPFRIEDNDVAENRADHGGGLAHCRLFVSSNRIRANFATFDGGGATECDGALTNNVIVGNQAAEGAGVAYCDGMVCGNLISGNSARLGGGLARCNGAVQNNTVVRNRADEDGGGLFQCYGMASNSVIWGNSAPDGAQLYGSNAPTYSCIQDWTESGEGDISDDPLFADPDGPDNDPQTHADNDYRLLPGSPCIDAGFNDPQLPETDIAGMPRILFGGKSVTVDMGAYEFYINKLEPVPGTDEAVFTWSSVADKTYSIFYTDDLLTWHLLVSAFPSSGNQTTSWTDDGALTGVPPRLVPRRFYRTLQTE